MHEEVNYLPFRALTMKKILFFIFLLFPLDLHDEPPVIAEVAHPKVKAAMRYHGIMHSYELRGKHYFDKAGKRIILFTEDFNKFYLRSLVFGKPDS